MKWDDDILEENHVLISEWDGESTNNTCQDIEKLSGTIEFMNLMDKSEETFVDGLSNHLSSWYKFGVEFMKNVLKVVSFHRFF